MRRLKFGKYAGVKVRGTVPIGPISEDYHLERAEWLTAQVESGGVFGTVQSYDGAGITAGLHQTIACYPRSPGQGPLWALLENVIETTSELERPALFDALDDKGYSILNNTLWNADKRVKRARMRREFTGSNNGVMPVKGPGRERAEKWALLFHKCFTDFVTFEAQKDAGRQWILSRVGTKLRKSRKFKKKTIGQVVYGGAPVLYETADYFGPEIDLALSVYWSHSVNAPAAALRRICKAADERDPRKEPRDFAKALIRRLGRAKYGRWHYTVKNGRYQRTRRAASKAWPKELFRGKGAIMPLRF